MQPNPVSETGVTPRRTAMVRRATHLVHTAAWLSLCLGIGQAHGQYTRNPLRTVTGTVTDAGHEPLRGAVVQIEAADTLVIQSYETNETGAYHFRNLRPDCDYNVWATFRGNRSKTHGVGKFDRQLDRDIPLTVVLEK